MPEAEKQTTAKKRNPFTAAINRGRYLRYKHNMHKKLMKYEESMRNDRHPNPEMI